ncbi:MAG: response regulator, partial [Geminicoccaceae bacterium]
MTPRRSAVDLGAAFERQPSRVLVVDDDPVVRVLLREMLIAKGHDVEEAESASKAEMRLRRGTWDLVLL